MNISFVGAGKVGTAFGFYLKSKGFQLKGYFSRKVSSAEKAAIFTGSKAYHDLESFIADADIIFITTSDDQIVNAARTISDSINESLLTGKYFCHMSGAHSIEVLSSLSEKGAKCFSLHPLQAFATVEDAIDLLEETVFSFEQDGESEMMTDFLEKLGNEYFQISSDQKAKYHMAACVMSNYLVTLVDQGLSILDSAGVERAVALKAFKPLLEGSLKNVLQLDAEKALTGPIARGDLQTVETHLKSFKEEEVKIEDFYRTMGQLTADLAQKSGKISEDKRRMLSKLLK